MTKDVLIKVCGMQYDVADEAIELEIEGTYYLKNGKHYVLYDEQPESGFLIKNIVKFNDSVFEMTKKGSNNSYLKFQKGTSTSSMYQTPVGPMQVDVFSKEYDYCETEQEIKVDIKYSLDLNRVFMSDCEVVFTVQARNS